MDMIIKLGAVAEWALIIVWTSHRLKEKLQKVDNMMVELLDTPAAKFVERRGTMIEDDFGRNNPWSRDWFCPWKECEPCRGRLFLTKEVDEEALMAVAGKVNEEGKKK